MGKGYLINTSHNCTGREQFSFTLPLFYTFTLKQPVSLYFWLLYKATVTVSNMNKNQVFIISLSRQQVVQGYLLFFVSFRLIKKKAKNNSTPKNLHKLYIFLKYFITLHKNSSSQSSYCIPFHWEIVCGWTTEIYTPSSWLVSSMAFIALDWSTPTSDFFVQVTIMYYNTALVSTVWVTFMCWRSVLFHPQALSSPSFCFRSLNGA